MSAPAATPGIQLRLAGRQHQAPVLEYIQAGHQLEGIQQSREQTSRTVMPLLDADGPGRIWLIELAGQAIGYVALCFGYSIEFGGRDAFIDELYIAPAHRGNGYGKTTLELLKAEAQALDVRALHLEVAHTNDSARRLYAAAGFSLRQGYALMSQRLVD